MIDLVLLSAPSSPHHSHLRTLPVQTHRHPLTALKHNDDEQMHLFSWKWSVFFNNPRGEGESGLLQLIGEQCCDSLSLRASSRLSYLWEISLSGSLTHTEQAVYRAIKWYHRKVTFYSTRQCQCHSRRSCSPSHCDTLMGLGGLNVMLKTWCWECLDPIIFKCDSVSSFYKFPLVKWYHQFLD